MAKTITGLALIKNDIQYVNSATSAGSIQQIPTPESGVTVVDVWAIPVNSGVYAGWRLLAYNPSNPVEAVAPTVSSIACCQVNSTISSDWFVVLGTSSAYITAANGGSALPIVWPNLSHTKALLPACQVLNTTDANGKYVATLGVPSIGFGENWFPFGNWNGFNLPAATANGYANMTTLLAFLNTATTNSGTATNPVYAGGWAIVGTWTSTGDFLTLIATQTAGSGTDVLCANVIGIQVSA